MELELCPHAQSCTRTKPEPEPMDIHETTVEQEIAAEPEMAEEYEETITLSTADVYALQDTLEDIQFQISDIQRDACQDRLNSQVMLQEILSRLPPESRASPLAPGASSTPPQ